MSELLAFGRDQKALSSTFVHNEDGSGAVMMRSGSLHPELRLTAAEVAQALKAWTAPKPTPPAPVPPVPPAPTPPAPTPPTPPAPSTGTLVGVYEGAIAVSAVQDFAKWSGAPVKVVTDYLDGTGWATITSPSYWTNGWKGTGYQLILSVPMLPKGATLAQGAMGAYDTYWTQLAKALDAAGYADGQVLRIGWEMNGNWFPWTIAKGCETVYAEYWRRIVAAMRAVNPGFLFDWCPNAGSSPGCNPVNAYPGDDYVDYIGIDTYDGGNWQTALTRPYGLSWVATFAKEHGKPLAVDEWGVKNGSEGGGDDPSYIENMHAWFAANNVVWQSYFDHDEPGQDHALRNGQFPNAAKAYQRLFG